MRNVRVKADLCLLGRTIPRSLRLPSSIRPTLADTKKLYLDLSQASITPRSISAAAIGDHFPLVLPPALISRESLEVILEPNFLKHPPLLPRGAVLIDAGSATRDNNRITPLLGAREINDQVLIRRCVVVDEDVGTEVPRPQHGAPYRRLRGAVPRPTGVQRGLEVEWTRYVEFDPEGCVVFRLDEAGGDGARAEASGAVFCERAVLGVDSH